MELTPALRQLRDAIARRSDREVLSLALTITKMAEQAKLTTCVDVLNRVMARCLRGEYDRCNLLVEDVLIIHRSRNAATVAVRARGGSGVAA